MMFDGKTLFEITDLRKLPADQKLHMIGLLESVPGGVQVFDPDDRGAYIELSEDNFEIDAGHLTVHTNVGMIVFTPLFKGEEADVFLLFEDDYEGLVAACQ
jgi:hypothetical protein